jgi:heat shock protein HspQ
VRIFVWCCRQFRWQQHPPFKVSTVEVQSSRWHHSTGVGGVQKRRWLVDCRAAFLQCGMFPRFEVGPKPASWVAGPEFAGAARSRYADAAAIRDRLNTLEAEANSAAAVAAEWRGTQAPLFLLGQRVVHVKHGYRGVVCGCVSMRRPSPPADAVRMRCLCLLGNARGAAKADSVPRVAARWLRTPASLHLGSWRGSGWVPVCLGCRWDVHCCEEEGWQEVTGVRSLKRGPAQPFYHVLVDSRDWGFDVEQPPVAYVAEELLADVEVGCALLAWLFWTGFVRVEHAIALAWCLNDRGVVPRGDVSWGA